jgi:hypothetical protein
MKDEKPNVIDIDKSTGKITQVSTDHDKMTFKS